MSVHALRDSRPAATDWRAVLAELGPQLAEEERRCDRANEFVGANIAALRERGFLELGVPSELGGPGLSRTELAAMLRELAHHGSSTHPRARGRGLALAPPEGADRGPAQARRDRAHP